MSADVDTDPSLTDGSSGSGGGDGSLSASPSSASASASPATIDPALMQALQQHIATAVPSVVQGNAAVFNQYMSMKETENVLQAFATDPNSFTLLVHKRIQKSAANTAASSPSASQEGKDDSLIESYSFDLETKAPSVSDRDKSVCSVVLIKLSTSLDASSAMSSQLLVLSLQESILFETMLAYVRHCFLPYSRAWMSGGGEQEEKKEADLAVYRGVNRKLGELEVELLRFQESISIPHIVLDVPLPIAEFLRSSRAAGHANPKVEDMGSIASDPAFLNDLQRQLNEWKKSIVRVTKLNRDVSSGSTIQEVNFWLAMERAVNHIYDAKESQPVEFTFAILRQNKRFLATTGFMQDVGLSEEGRGKDKVHRYASFLRDLPIKRMLSAADAMDLIRSIELTFTHLKQIRRIDYPLSRCIALVHTLSRDVVRQIQTAVLPSRSLMQLPYGDFVQLADGVEQVFQVWNEKTQEFADMMRALGKKQPGESMAKLKEPYTEMEELRARIQEIRKIRKEHEQLRNVIASTLTHDALSKQSALHQVHAAYAYFQDSDSAVLPPSSSPSSSSSSARLAAQAAASASGINVLSITPDGKDAWKAAVNAYRNKIDSVEAELESTIRSLLDHAKENSSEMFRICAKFNPLFVRPRIQSAIREYQEQLIGTVKKDLDALAAKFSSKTASAEARRMSELLRDLPPVSSAIIWAKQIERQLNMLMSRVEQVLGHNWHHHFDGRQLKRDSDDFRAKLAPARLYQHWLQDKLESLAGKQVSGNIFSVVATAKQSTLRVNFDQRLVTLFKEVRMLQRLDCKPPFELLSAADEARQNYPFAMRLEEVLRIYTRTCAKIAASPALQLLAAGLQLSMQHLLARGAGLKLGGGQVVARAPIQWLDSHVKDYVDQLATQSVDFQDAVDELSEWVEQADHAVSKLAACTPDPATLQHSMHAMHSVIEQLEKRRFTNLQQYIQTLDAKVEAILVDRCKILLAAFAAAIEQQYDEAGNLIKPPKHNQDLDDEDEDEKSKDEMKNEMNGSSSRASLTSLIALVSPPPLRHEVLIRNQTLIVEPSLETSRIYLIRQLHRWLSLIIDLPRLSASIHDAAAAAGDEASSARKREEATYRSVLAKLPSPTLRACLTAIDRRVTIARAYVDTWLQYQALWDMDLNDLINELGTDLRAWESILNDMKTARATFDTSATRTRFGPILVDYAAVQSKVNNKYDNWHKSVLARLGQLLGDRLLQMFTTLRNARESLEKHAFDVTSTADMVDSVTLLQSLSKQAKTWKADLTHAASVEKVLSRARYHFPPDWLLAERVTGEWNAFEQILSRKLVKLSEQSGAIQSHILSEDAALEKRIKEFTQEWSKNRPVAGGISHSEATRSLQAFDATLTKLEGDASRLDAAKRALDLGVREGESARLNSIREELKGLQEIWSALRTIWLEVDTLASKPFKTIPAPDVRRALAKLQSEQAKLPNWMKTYEGYDYLKQTLKNYLSLNANIVDLHSPMIRPKHEKQILKELGLSQLAWSEVTLGHLWSVPDWPVHVKAVRHILDTAQGESALEAFLTELREEWEGTRLTLADYKGNVPLIRNWDSIFAQLADRLSDLSGIKQSPFFKVFESESLRWEAKLNAAQAIFDVFIDVQRRWLSMSGTFEGSADIQQQLAAQWKKFKTLDRDFTRLMRDIKKDPTVDLLVRDERNLLQELTAYADTLTAIQKALGDYLEQQRRAFPRFYFIGDDALLEIIGNAKNPVKVIPHLSKLFAGIASLGIESDGRTITSMISSEGEVVKFSEPVVITEKSSVHAWLTQVEYQMRMTLAQLLERGVEQMLRFDSDDNVSYDRAHAAAYEQTVNNFFAWVDSYPAQIVLLATQVYWSQNVEQALTGAESAVAALRTVLFRLESSLEFLADRILRPDLSASSRKSYEQLITEKVHQRDVTRSLLREGVTRTDDFKWLAQTRFYFTPLNKLIAHEKATGKTQTQTHDGKTEPAVMRCLQIRIARAQFHYGWEYFGAVEKLVQTPLTDRVYLTMGEALHMRLGGNPFGPAGTGKTETVKAMGTTLGRMTLVFCCDETFDFTAMGRIFVGLCQCGAWGCFDEFNRLEERILSAVSQQILTIQVGLREDRESITLMDKEVKLDPRVGLFITMNPGYAGRSELPDNLKQLFRGMAMVSADKSLIAQVMLYSQGFRSAEDLSTKVTMLFQLCEAQLSARSHYDFGLRALKSVLRSAGNLKRAHVAQMSKRKEREEEKSKEEAENEDEVKSKEDDEAATTSPTPSKSPAEVEQDLLVRSICATISPKLVSSDIGLFSTLVQAVFPGAALHSPNVPALRAAIRQLCNQPELSLEQGSEWLDKIMQLNEIISIHHGVIVVGPAASGKSKAIQLLKQAVEQVEGRKISTYVIDPKAISKDDLYGSLDSTTLEFTDGVFTSILRRILDNVRGEASRDHWIIFDGDVDPNWVENLNSVLDDNKLLTLPNGERLALTPNIRIMFEVQNLDFATPATVSRCGMVWFSSLEVLPTAAIMVHMLKLLKTETLQLVNVAPSVFARWKHTQKRCVELLEPLFGVTEEVLKAASGAEGAPLISEQEPVANCFVLNALNWIEHECSHIMTFSRTQCLVSLFSMLKCGIARIIEYNESHPDFPMADKSMEAFLSKYVVWATLWAFAGGLALKERLRFCTELAQLTPPAIAMPDTSRAQLIDYEVHLEDGDWRLYDERIDQLDLEPHKCVRADVVIDTVDTARHTDVIHSWLTDHRPLILCGPPGSGKSMTLTAVLRSLPEFELVTLNFSSTTTPKLLLDTLQHYCKVDRTPLGQVMHPVVQNKWLVIFCDEINLPSMDAYDTVPVLTFLRQLAEHGGFWRASDLSFIRLERIQFLGACNPPTDAGRVPLSPRLLRHSPLLFVDFPAVPSLRTIYGTFNRALLKLVPSLRSHSDSLTEAMIEVYTGSQSRFTPDQQSHYIYSPRELSRWVRAMYEAMKPSAEGGGSVGSAMSVDELVRLWLHEALRLFQDRLVYPEERKWTDELVDGVAKKHFASVDHDSALARPVLFSNWLTKNYTSVGQAALREHVKTRLRVFNEEELDVKLVIFDEVLDHILRIDRVLRQPLGHLLLVGSSGAGKTILSKFVSWMQGLSVFQIKVHKHYSDKDFDKDLRMVLTRSGCRNERICFIFDESNVLSTAFLERMNALLASGEVPGLFEGADFTALMAECREAARKEGVLLDGDEELYRHFVTQVQRNLHIVFTMNPTSDDFSNRSATSPALFNRCVIDWFGEWSSDALFQVALEQTKTLDLGDGLIEDADEHEEEKGDEKKNPDEIEENKPQISTVREAVVSSIVFVHESVTALNKALSTAHAGAKSTHNTPRHFLDFIRQYSKLFHEQRSLLEEQQRHLTTGLRKLTDTSSEVLKLQTALQSKDVELRDKKALANAKLEQIMVDQREAETKRDASVRIGEEIREQEGRMAERKQSVEGELAQARPALEEAENAVRSIKKADIDTVSRFPSPPQPVKFTLEAVATMLGESASDWADLKKVIRKPDFIKSVINFDVTTLTEKTREMLMTKYVNHPQFTYEIVNNASKACGPLVKWVTSTLHFSRIKNSVAPLEAELAKVAATQADLKRKQEELQKLRDELGARIDQYKSEYSTLIAEVERIKAEMSQVQTKVDRSMALISNLGSERARWESDAAQFQTQIGTLVGDCLLAAAFLAYAGYYNQNQRHGLIDQWQDRLHEMKVPVKPDLNLIEYLSTPSQRLEWTDNKLPADELATENAIMIERFGRYPLLIDPSGQAVTFLMHQYASRKIVRTSFLDDSFLKLLESALRFGNALLVEDVENIDPVLNSVLNREITKTGGRVTISLGDKEIDYSPAFTIFLSTRDAASRFAADLCSRVTLISFVTTPASLTRQCLGKILRAERADIDTKRSDLIKLQGEFRVRLRQLEDALLNKLNSIRGNILDSEEIITSLETLKQEAADVSQKMEAAEGVMAEVERVSNTFKPFASACSSIYFALEKLADVHFLYQFSLPFFLQVVDSLLFPPSSEHVIAELADEKDGAKRLIILTKHLFRRSYIRVSRALLNQDLAPFAMRLAQIALDDAQLNGSTPLDPVEVEFFMKGSIYGLGGAATKKAAGEELAEVPDTLGLSRAQRALLATLGKLPSMAKLLPHLNSAANLEAWKRYLQAHSTSAKTEKNEEESSESSSSAPRVYPELLPPTGWESASNLPRHVYLFHCLLIARTLRSDRVPPLAFSFADAVFNERLQDLVGVDLQRLVQHESSAQTPLLLVSKPGFDASGRVDSLAVALNQQNSYVSMAMGSPQGYEQADAAIHAAMKKGTMLLLKNVHLSSSYLSSLEKRLHRLAATAHPSFRLFLTAELHEKLPSNLLRMSNIILFEPPVGIKSSLRRSFANMSAHRVNRAPAERARLYFLLAWLHAVILERLRYTPVAWVKAFEFSETDQQCAMDVIDEWVDRAAQGRANIQPAKLPWDAIRQSLEQVIYGGRVDNDFDQKRLHAFVQAIFTPQSYETNFPLCSSYDKESKQFKPLLTMPDASNYDGFRAWIDAMDDNTNPELLGLQPTAELMLLSNHATRIEASLMAIQDEQREEDSTAGGGHVRRLSGVPPAIDRGQSIVAGDASSRPAWMNIMDRTITIWLSKLPTVHAFTEANVILKNAKAGSNNSEFAKLNHNPIFRCVQREYTILLHMLERVQSDLTSLRDVLTGVSKPNNHIRDLLSKLRRDLLPTGWYRAGMPKNLTPGRWMDDFQARLHQIQTLVQLRPNEYTHTPIWLGGLQAPEGLVAATRQAVAHAHHWPLEQLELRVSVGDDTPNPDSFVFKGLQLYGAQWSGGLSLGDESKLSTPLDQVRLTWIHRSAAAPSSSTTEQADDKLVRVPVYLDATRQQYLFEMQLPQTSEMERQNKDVWAQRGTSITVWSSEGSANAQQ